MGSSAQCVCYAYIRSTLHRTIYQLSNQILTSIIYNLNEGLCQNPYIITIVSTLLILYLCHAYVRKTPKKKGMPAVE